MFCPNCGTDLTDALRFCPNCGTRLANPETPAAPQQGDAQPQQPPCPLPNQQPQYPPYPQQADLQQPLQSSAPQMNWYKFLIYFALFASAAIGFINAIMFLIGTINGSPAEARLFYACFPDWRILDIIIGVLMIVCVALLLLTRFRLSGFHKNGPMLLTLTYAALATVNLAYMVGAIIVASSYGIGIAELSLFPTISNTVSALVLMVVNLVYFGKRQALFNK